MKRFVKILPILSLGALLLSSCFHEEGGVRDEGGEVSFSASISESEATRAVVAGTSLPNGTYFGVSAYVDGSTTPYTDSRSGNTVSNIQIGYNGAYRNSSDKAYWPASTETINFHAYYPYNGSGITTNFDQATKTIVFTTPTNADLDLMYASASGTRSDGMIELTFKHILAWLNVRALVNDDDATGQAIAITGVTLKSQQGGTYTIGSATPWGTRTTRANRTASGTFPKAVGTSSATIADFMIVPQALTNVNNQLVVNYTLGGTPKTLTIPGANLPAMAANTSEGKKFMLTITFKLIDASDPDISLSSSVVNWNPVDLGNISVE